MFTRCHIVTPNSMSNSWASWPQDHPKKPDAWTAPWYPHDRTVTRIHNNSVSISIFSHDVHEIPNYPQLISILSPFFFPLPFDSPRIWHQMLQSMPLPSRWRRSMRNWMCWWTTPPSPLRSLERQDFDVEQMLDVNNVSTKIIFDMYYIYNYIWW